MTNALIRDWWEELFQIHEFAHYGDYAADLTRREVDFLMEALGLSGVETILDLACGGGRHAIELTRRGLTVIGVDIVKPLITAAKARAAELDLSIEFVQGDMRELHYEARFDVVLIMNSSLGFFDDATNQAVLAGAVRSLAPGGRLLLQCINPYQIDRYMREFRNGWYAVGSGYVLREARFDPLSASLVIDYRYLDPAQSLEVQHPGDRIRLYGFPELKAMLQAVGMRPLSAFGDAVLPPEPFGEPSQWQVIVAQKPRLLSDEDEEAG